MLRTVIICLSLIAAVLADAALPELLEAFDSKRRELGTARDQKLSTLKENYLAALERHRAATQQTGKLERVLPIRNELKAVRASEPAELAGAAKRDPKLVGLRGKYEQARSKILDGYYQAAVELAQRMEELIDKEIEKLTRAGRLEQAVEAKELRTTIRPLLGLSATEEAPEEGTGDGLAPAKDAAGFMDLLNFPFKIERSTHYTGPPDGEGGMGKPNPPVISWLKTQHKKPEEIFVMGSNSSVEFKLSHQVFEFKGIARVLRGADVTFRVRVRGKVVLEHRLSGNDCGPKNLNCSFTPSSHITLELESTRADSYKAAAWFHPKVR